MSLFQSLRKFLGAKAADRRQAPRPSFRPSAERLESRLTPAVRVTPLTGLVTTEAHGTATFNVVLTTKPTASVFIPLRTSDQTEGSVSTSGLIFNSTNWNTPKTVTVRGVNDFVDDGNIPYQIILDPASSAKIPWLEPRDLNVDEIDLSAQSWDSFRSRISSNDPWGPGVILGDLKTVRIQ